MDEQTEMELGQEAQCLEHENQREQLLAETQEFNKQLQAKVKRLEKINDALVEISRIRNIILIDALIVYGIYLWICR